jgi:hypothetical protein
MHPELLLLVNPRAPAANGPSISTDSTSAARAQFLTLVQKFHANSTVISQWLSAHTSRRAHLEPLPYYDGTDARFLRCANRMPRSGRLVDHSDKGSSGRFP